MKKSKKHYQTPMTEVSELYPEKFMIEIGSGNTSPEESDTNASFFDQDDDYAEIRSRSLWDE